MLLVWTSSNTNSSKTDYYYYYLSVLLLSVNYTDDLHAVIIRKAVARYDCSFPPQITPLVADTQSTDPHIIEVGHPVHSTTVIRHRQCTSKLHDSYTSLLILLTTECLVVEETGHGA